MPRSMIAMKRQFLLFFLLLSVSFSYLFAQTSIDPNRITIIRDSYGVPHIYAPTDPEVAYGLAWANAEDDFEDMQRNFLIGRSKLGLVEGKEGAAADFLVHFLGIRDSVSKRYDTDVSPEFKAYLDGFCQGINAFAKAHPKEVFLKNTFPVYPQDILTSYGFSVCLMSGAGTEIQNVIKGRAGAPNSHSIRGSNGVAVNSSKTADGEVYFVSNSHQPHNGPLAWYEAHLVSEEGMNVLGALFPGGTSVFVGTNEHLAWTHTIAFDDYVDVFELEMNPEEKLQYKMDGKWLTLEEKKVSLKVKVAGVPLGIPKTIYGSAYGPTLKTKEGFFAFRMGALFTIKSAEQWFRMDKATNFDEWKAAIDMQGLSGFNAVYGDAEDNIFYQDLGQIPHRAAGYDWQTKVPGNTKATLWQGVYKNEEVPWVKNPPCGYVYNTNNSPLICTSPADRPDPKQYPTEMGLKIDDNNRGIRYEALLSESEKMTYEQFKTAKYDTRWPEPIFGLFAKNMEDCFHLSPEKYPEIAPGIEVLSKWNREASLENEQAGLAFMTLNHILKVAREKKIMSVRQDWEESEWVDAVAFAQKYMKKHFGKLEVPFGEVQRIKRGKKDYPIFGMLDMISTSWSKKGKNGRYFVNGGDSYIQFVRFTKDGPKIESCVPFGTSDREGSPHFDDQVELFIHQKTKPISMNKAEIQKSAERTYHPMK